MMKYFVAALVALAPSLAWAQAQEEDYLAVCEEVIASRQPVPDLFSRVSYTFDEHVLSWEEHEEELRKMKAEQFLIERNKKRFDDGTFTPTIIKLVVEYDATDESSTVVRKKSLCAFRMNEPSQKPSVDMVFVDGMPQFVWERKDAPRP